MTTTFNNEPDYELITQAVINLVKEINYVDLVDGKDMGDSSRE